MDPIGWHCGKIVADLGYYTSIPSHLIASIDAVGLCLMPDALPAYLAPGMLLLLGIARVLVYTLAIIVFDKFGLAMFQRTNTPTQRAFIRAHLCPEQTDEEFTASAFTYSLIGLVIGWAHQAYEGKEMSFQGALMGLCRLWIAVIVALVTAGIFEYLLKLKLMLGSDQGGEKDALKVLVARKGHERRRRRA
ncbi:hypothetical protein LTR37_002037 [Vermiconidia calcicola]|uniref:Uncharacterized protein n=1 Tax=Vermiconidia calcicola TaxID=1690605 RepID=A0ACC3NV58_9PEZI|nr:hypothetical protein LTR37_002037 [Vermiconidia calcicola]